MKTLKVNVTDDERAALSQKAFEAGFHSIESYVLYVTGDGPRIFTEMLEVRLGKIKAGTEFGLAELIEEPISHIVRSHIGRLFKIAMTRGFYPVELLEKRMGHPQKYIKL